MIDGMIKNEVGALVTFLPRKTSSPRICLLLAQVRIPSRLGMRANEM